MQRILFIFILSFCLTGCANDKPTALEKPPNASIQIGEHSYETTLGSYCWSEEGKGTCVDKAGPVELLEKQTPIEVSPGEKITFTLDYEPKPTEEHVTQFHHNEEMDVQVKDQQFTAPLKKGVYYYGYSVWWNDEKEPNVSKGDAVYTFVIEVK
ncbi:hypothetical protein [Bacillus sp. REN10]|uniref:hypothetical protein n=1 Tax=Bacillus sp. REN10 TaxID=2782541 RepID=UPI00193C6B80|nr:hypothetical protein [Bacillus sp. REN10]